MSMDTITKCSLISLRMFLFNLALFSTLVCARPENIRPGLTYYSDDYVVQGLVSDIAAEKNYEEVYRFYNYYEAVYDENGRVKTFKEYKQGEIIRTEEYHYNATGALIERVLKRPGKQPEITKINGSEAGSQR